MTPPSFWQFVVSMFKEMRDEMQPERIAARMDAWVAKQNEPRRGWWGFDRLPRRGLTRDEEGGAPMFRRRTMKGERITDVASLFQPKRDPGIATPWCEEHNLPMRLMSFGTDDRIVCWLPWLYPDEARFGIRACIEGSRIVSPPLDSHPPLTG